MIVPGPKLTKVFASRWNAVWWGAGILLTAYCSIPSAQESNEEAGQTTPASHNAANPWAKDPAPAQ